MTRLQLPSIKSILSLIYLFFIMPITLRASKVLKELTNEDIRVLHMVETLLKRGEYAPIHLIIKYSGYHESDVEMKLSKLHKLNLLQRWKGHFVGYTLTISGFDSLALNALYNQKEIYGVGMSLGVGKESDVYYGIDFEENEKLLKFNRTGRTSFQHVKRKRGYVKNRRHYNMFFLAAVSAQREYDVLKLLNEKSFAVPKVFAHNRHLIVMEILDGLELININANQIQNPEKTLKEIIEFAKRLYQELELVHGDLTAYNILYNEKTHKLTFIDFPQAVKTSHPEALNLLTRDLEHLCNFFAKKYNISAEVKSVLEYITKG